MVRPAMDSFRVMLVVAVLLALAGVWWLRPVPRMGGETPEELLAAMHRHWRSGEADPAWLGPRLSQVGKEIWQQLRNDPPPEQKPITVYAAHSPDGHYEIHHRIHDVRIAWTFWFEDGVWRFHDLFIFEVGSMQWHVHASLILRNPADAAGQLAGKNPGTTWQVHLGSLGDRNFLPPMTPHFPALRAKRLDR